MSMIACRFARQSGQNSSRFLSKEAPPCREKKKRNKKQSQPKSAFTPIPRERALIPLEKKTLVAQEAAVEVPASAEEKAVAVGRVALRARHRRAGHTRRRVVLSAALVFHAGRCRCGRVCARCAALQKLDPLKLTRLSQTSRLYDNEGSLVTKLRAQKNRTLVSLSEVPVAVRAAFIAAEDLRFYEHNGFDLVRIFGALVADLKSQSFSQGASTITQQLVKLTHLTNEKTIARKAEELYLAIQLEQAFDKDEILEMYLKHRLLWQQRLRYPGGGGILFCQGRFRADCRRGSRFGGHHQSAFGLFAHRRAGSQPHPSKLHPHNHGRKRHVARFGGSRRARAGAGRRAQHACPPTSTVGTWTQRWRRRRRCLASPQTSC